MGYSATISDVNAYIGCEQMKDIDLLINKQRENAAKWFDVLDNNKHIIKPLTLTNSNPNYWVFGCLAENKLEAIQYFRDKGFYASGVHINNNRYSTFGVYEKLKGVESFYNNFVALPSGWWVNTNDIFI